MSNLSDTPANESPDALAGAIGANFVCETTVPNIYNNRLNLASAAIRALADCHPDVRDEIIDRVIEKTRAGQPVPALFNLMNEARDWASWASRNELKAYGAAIVERLSPSDLAAFIGWAGEVAA